MITWLYVLIAGWLLYLTVYNLYKEERPLLQLTCALVAIPLLLRVLGIK